MRQVNELSRGSEKVKQEKKELWSKRLLTLEAV